jgi:ADP-ribose pyrophosphatase YjhB (NUDIX family)
MASGCCQAGVSSHAKYLVTTAVREMREETGLIVCLTRPVGVFGGPDFIIEYQNGHRTSDVMAVFDATSAEGNPLP